MATATRPQDWTRIRSGRRGLLLLAGGTAVAAAVAAACSGDDKPKTAGAPQAAATAPTASPPSAFPNDQRVRVQHLLRRAGFAPSEAEVQRALGMKQDELVDLVLNPERTPDGLDPQLTTLDSGQEMRPEELVGWWLARMAATATPSLEKLTLFWHGIHTSGFDKVGARRAFLLYQQNLFQRQSAFGAFPAILKAISRQPAMMLYLDTQTNVKAHPNENFARELMELFSMGVGNYSETDVREAARAFTGYSIDGRTGEFVMRTTLHDAGPKTVLGRTGAFSGDDVVDIIMQQPATPRFVARKLWSFFVAPNPDDQTIAPVAKAFGDSGGDMRATLRAVLTHPAFYSGAAYRSLVKSPVEYGVGAVRQLGLTPRGPELSAWSRQMGQIPFYPPNVAGWPGGAAWMGSGTFLARMNGINAMLFGRQAAGRAGQNAQNPKQDQTRTPRAGATGRTQPAASPAGGLDVSHYLDEHKLATAGALVDHLLTLLVDGQVSRDTRTALVDYASGGGGEGASLSALPAAERDQRVRGAAYLVMAGPEYHLA